MYNHQGNPPQDHNGTIDQHELRDVMKNLNNTWTPSDEELMDMIHEVLYNLVIPRRYTVIERGRENHGISRGTVYRGSDY